MRVALSPVSSWSAEVWIGFARSALALAVSDLEPDPLIDRAMEVRLAELLDSWEVEARRGPRLSLSFEIPDDEAEFLVHAFLRLADRWTVVADRRGFDVSPPEGDEFYSALVEGVIAAMEHAEDASGVEFGTALRTIWPRVERLGDPPDATPPD